MTELHDLTALEQGPLGRERHERADRVEPVGAFEVVLGELERRHLTASDERALLQRGQVVEFGHDQKLPGSGSLGLGVVVHEGLDGGTQAVEDLRVGQHVDLERRLRDGDVLHDDRTGDAGGAVVVEDVTVSQSALEVDVLTDPEVLDRLRAAVQTLVDYDAEAAAA